MLATVELFVNLEDKMRSLFGVDASGDIVFEQRLAIFSLAIVFLVQSFVSSRVSVARRKHGVPMPFMYPHSNSVKDPAGYMAIVRGHENFIEELPMHLALHVLLQVLPPGQGGCPLIAVCGSMLFAVGRILFADGYVAPIGPDGRLLGSIISRFGTFLQLGVLLRFAVLGK